MLISLINLTTSAKKSKARLQFIYIKKAKKVSKIFKIVFIIAFILKYYN